MALPLGLVYGLQSQHLDSPPAEWRIHKPQPPCPLQPLMEDLVQREPKVVLVGYGTLM